MAAAKKYAEGVELTLYPFTNSQKPEASCALTIKATIQVEVRRRSQIVLAVTTHRADTPSGRNVDSSQTVVLKIFDPEFGPPEAGPDEPDCAHLARVEAEAYSKLASLGGNEVPIFYGLYSFFKSSVIMMEYIQLPNLSRSNPSLNEPALRLALSTLVGKLHDLDVYHLDIRSDNLFWDEKRMVIIDFEKSICSPKVEGEKTRLEKVDYVDMWLVLRQFGAQVPWENTA
jgi:serine/threonine protein kinase